MKSSPLPRVNAFVAAGKVPPEDDPLYTLSRGGPKALIDVGGKPMVQWVLDALDGAESVERIAILGLSEQDGLRATKPLTFLEEHGGLLQNSLAGLEWARRIGSDREYVLFASADLPTLTPEIVDWRVRQATGPQVDLDFVAVKRTVMERRFPDSSRTYVKLRNVEICGGDIHLIHVHMDVDLDLWDRLIGARKSPLRQAAVVGFDTLLLLLLRRLTLDQTLQRIAARLNLRGRVHLSPWAEVAMDVDKPGQLELIRRDLAQGQPP